MAAPGLGTMAIRNTGVGKTRGVSERRSELVTKIKDSAKYFMEKSILERGKA